MSREPLAVMFFNPFRRGYFWLAFSATQSPYQDQDCACLTPLNIDHNGKLRQKEKCDGSHCWGGRGSEYLGQGGKWLRGRSESQSADGFRVDCSILVHSPQIFEHTLGSVSSMVFWHSKTFQSRFSIWDVWRAKSIALSLCSRLWSLKREVSFSTILVLQQHGLCARDN